MHQLCHRDLVDGLDRRLDVVVLQLYRRLHHLLHLVNDMDLKLVRHLYEVGNFLCQHLLVVVHLDALQSLDVLNLDVRLPFLDVGHLVVVLVDVELRHLQRMDYFQVAVDVELRRLMRMDYFQDEALLVESVQLMMLLPQLLLPQLLQLLHPLVQPFQHRVMP